MRISELRGREDTHRICIGENGTDAIRGMRDVDRQISTAGVEHSGERDDEFGGTWQHDREECSRLWTQRDEMSGETIRPRGKLTIGQGGIGVVHGRGRRGPCGPVGEDACDRCRPGVDARFVPAFEHPTLARVDELHVAHRDVGVGGHHPQGPREAIRETLRRRLIEDIRGVGQSHHHPGRLPLRIEPFCHTGQQIVSGVARITVE